MNIHPDPLPPLDGPYAEADERLVGRCAQGRKIANNTYLERRPNGDIAVRLHATDVVTYHADNTATLNTGGWYTVTTKARIHSALPSGISLSSVRGRWFITYTGHWDDVTDTYVPSTRPAVPYADGMVIDLTTLDVIEGAPEPDAVAAADSANVATRKAIEAYLKRTTPEQIVHAFEHTGGDCWACAGTIPFDPEHLRGHLTADQHYVMVSLTQRAVVARGYRDPDFILGMIYDDAQRGKVSHFYTTAMRKYLRKQLITGVAVA